MATSESRIMYRPALRRAIPLLAVAALSVVLPSFRNPALAQKPDVLQLVADVPLPVPPSVSTIKA